MILRLKKLNFISLFLVLPHFLFAINKEYLDSLKHEIAKTKNVQTKIDCLYSLSFEYGLIDPRQGILYGKECLRLGKGEYLTSYKAYNALGNAYETLGLLDSARYYQQWALTIATKQKDPRRIGIALINLGACYKQDELYTEALSYYLKAMKLFKNEPNLNPRIHFFLGEIYIKLGNYSEAMKTSNEGIKLCENSGDNYFVYLLKVNLAKCDLVKGETEKAIKLLRECVSQLENHTDKTSIALAYNALGKAYFLAKKFALAKENYIKEEWLNHELGSKAAECLSKLNVIECDANLKQTNFSGIRKEISLTKSDLKFISRNKESLREYYSSMAQIYEHIHEPDSALRYLKLNLESNNQLINRESVKQLNELQTRFKTAEQEHRIALKSNEIEAQRNEIRKKQYAIVSITSVFIILVLIGLFYYDRFRTSKKLELILEIQKQEKNKELAVKQKEIEERKRISQDIHDDLGSGISKIILLSEVLKNQNGQDIKPSLSKIATTAGELADNMHELVWVLSNETLELNVLVARMNEFARDYLETTNMEVNYKIDEIEDTIPIPRNIYRNLLLSYKEAITNSVRHANATEMNIAIGYSNKQLSVLVEDNGVGIREENSSQIKGNGMRNMKSRISESGGQLSVESEQGNGTKISFELSFQEI